jgi:hypothetical protein
MGSRAFAVSAVVTVVMVALAAEAAPVDQKKEMAARKAFAAGEWSAALDLFAQLYAETLHPVYLRNIGRCHQRLREPQKAIDAFNDYLAKGKVSADERAEIQGYIKEMEALRQEKDAQAARAAKAEQPAPQPLPPTLRPEPPPAQIVTAPVPEEPPVYKRWWFWTAVGVAVAGGVAAALLLRPSSDNCPRGVTTCM